MPDFFLHIVERDQSLRDDQGILAADLAAARAEAFRIVAELLSSGSWAPTDAANHVNIADAAGRVLDTVAVWEVTSKQR